MDSKPKNDSIADDGYNAGKIFVGGLHWGTTLRLFVADAFSEHFASYGEITDEVIKKDLMTSQPRGFGFVTVAIPSVAAKVFEDTHTSRGSRGMVPTQAQSKEFEARRIFVGGTPSTVTEDEFKGFFSKYGKVVEHGIIWDHETNRSRKVGFITFDNEEVVDQMLFMGNMVEMGDAKVEIKKAEPKKFSNPPPTSKCNRSFIGWPYNANFVNPYGDFNGGYGPGLYRTPGLLDIGGYSRGEGFMGDGISDSPGPAASYRVPFGKGSCIDQ